MEPEDESSNGTGLHILTTDFVNGSDNLVEDLSTDEHKRNGELMDIPSIAAEASSSSCVLKKGDEIMLNSSFIPENAVLMETPRGLMLTVPGNMSYNEDHSPGDQPPQLLSCIPVSLFSADVDSAGDYGIAVSHENHETNGTGDQEHDDKTMIQPITDETTEICVTTKRKGGWPKGKKRKIKPMVTGPRAPVTGYVLYAMDRRKEIKESHPEISFPEVTKILGHEWSAMAHDVKQKYLQLAEEDKKRYREELNAFKSSDTYQETVRKKIFTNGDLVNESNDDILQCEEGNSGELHCGLCDVYFNNLHNKREHMYGKVHRQNVTDAMEKKLLQHQQDEQTLMEGALVVSEDVSQDSFPSNEDTESLSGPVDIHSFMMEFIQKNYEREMEISVLKKCLTKGLHDNVRLCKEIQALQDYQHKLEEEQKAIDASNTALIGQSEALKLIPTLFGITNL